MKDEKILLPQIGFSDGHTCCYSNGVSTDQTISTTITLFTGFRNVPVRYSKGDQKVERWTMQRFGNPDS